MNRLDRLRIACFAYFAQMDRTNKVRGVPIESHGRPAQTSDSLETWNGSGDSWRGLPCLTLSERATNERNRRPYVSTWTHTAGTTTAPVARLATDWASATRDAGLVDCQPMTSERTIWNVTPRHSIPDWEYLNESPHVTPRVVAFQHSSIRPAPAVDHVATELLPDWKVSCRCSAVALLYRVLENRKPLKNPANERAREIRIHQAVRRRCSCSPIGYEHVSTMPLAIHLSASESPQGYSPGAMALFARTSRFFREHGESHPAIDVWNKRHKRFILRADRTAFRGVARYQRLSPVRYESGWRYVKVNGAYVLNQHGKRTMEPRLDKVAFDIVTGAYALETRLSHAYDCRCGEAKADCTCTPRGWLGHRRTTFSLTTRNVLAIARKERTESTKRGPAVGAWQLAIASLPRRANGVKDSVARIESAIRTLGESDSITFADGTVATLLSPAQVGYRDTVYGIREFARRAAIAELALP